MEYHHLEKVLLYCIAGDELYELHYCKLGLKPKSTIGEWVCSHQVAVYVIKCMEEIIEEDTGLNAIHKNVWMILEGVKLKCTLYDSQLFIPPKHIPRIK